MTHPSPLDPPRATEYESQLLDQIDRLTAAAAKAAAEDDRGSYLDALDESLACERLLAESREKTWAIWFANVQRVGWAA